MKGGVYRMLTYIRTNIEKQIVSTNADDHINFNREKIYQVFGNKIVCPVL